jgi:mitochondrial import inner membrane translocase subunit TIM50
MLLRQVTQHLHKIRGTATLPRARPAFYCQEKFAFSTEKKDNTSTSNKASTEEKQEQFKEEYEEYQEQEQQN